MLEIQKADGTLVTVDHNVPTTDRSALLSVQSFIDETASRTQVLQLERNVEAFGLKYFGVKYPDGDIKADNDGKKLTLTFEMRIPSVIMLEITALDAPARRSTGERGDVRKSVDL